MILDGNTINVGIALLAGAASFFAPCVAPIVPAYIGYFTGVGLTDTSATHRRWRIVRYSLLSVLGFVGVFALLGLTATSIGNVFAAHRALIARAGGVVMVLLGLFLLGVFKVPALYRERKLNIHDKLTRYQGVNAALLGVTFGLAWTPCIGPVLAVILFLASQAETAVQGMVLMMAFGVGLGLPFLVLSLFVDRLLPYLRKSQRLQKGVHILSGLVIVLFGLLLATNLLGRVVAPLVQFGSLELLFID